MTVFDSIPVDRISAEARQVDFGRVVLTILAAIFYGLGWIAAKAFTIVWLALAWSAVAIKVGWTEGRKRS